MSSWSVNYLFLANAGLLILLACFLVSRRKSEVTWIFFATNLSLALWNICNFLIEQRLWMDQVATLARVQCLAGMMVANGLYYFCSSYPISHPSKTNWLNAAVFAGFAGSLFFSGLVTDATYTGGEVVYVDGPAFIYYSLYLSLLSLLAIYKLSRAWKRYPEHRSRIRYFFIGIFIYIVAAISCNLILPSLGNYDFLIVGRMAATFTLIFFFYAIAKYAFLDITVIINKAAAWLTTMAILIGALLLLDRFTQPWPVLNVLCRCAVVVVSGLYAVALQQFLLTSAKRKFIRGWYSTEEVINRLSGKITLEKSREAIFKEVAKVMDEVFELEDILTIVAVRDEHESFSYYKVVGKFQKIKNNDPLIEAMREQTACLRLEDASEHLKSRLEELNLKTRSGVILPFHSPEFLEGVVLLGERSNQKAYTESDLRFFNNLISFLSPVLYRLTPMEKLEQLYSESRQKLHEAEIQLIRVQKIESIVHATRQCHHEIRTPLNIIKLGIGRIKTLEDLEAYKEVAREEIGHALEIVDETLTITEVDKASNRAGDININDVIQRCLRLIDRTRYKVELDLGELPEVPAVFSDIQVVITNLLHNAMEAMPDGGGLAFTSKATATDVVITVEDDGEGIPDALRSKVWEPYFSGRGSEVGNSTGGRGWGLTIVNRIITAHQGTIRFTSEERVGTRFIITLPRRKGQEENPKNAQLSQAL